MKQHIIDICIYMYSLHKHSDFKRINDDPFWINEFQMLMENVDTYLNGLEIDSTLYSKSFEGFDMFKGVEDSGTVKKTNETIAVKIHTSDKLVKAPSKDLYRDHMISIDYDLIWFPAYIQINNVFTRGKEFNSFWTAKLFYKDLMKSLETASEQDYENGILVQDHLVVFDKSKFESNRIDVVY